MSAIIKNTFVFTVRRSKQFHCWKMRLHEAGDTNKANHSL